MSTPTPAPRDRRRPAGRSRAHRLVAAVALLLATAWLVVVPAGASGAVGDERMASFDAVYDLQSDGSVRVTETISWRFPSGQQRHGIFRDIVVRMGWNNEEGRYRFYDLTDVDVTSPTGAPDAFKVSDNGASEEIRIGSPDEWTSGTQTYVVRYTLHNVLNPITDAKTGAKTVELHYNVFGANEFTRRDRVRVTVNAPAPSTAVLCFRGERGSTDTCPATPGDPTRYAADGLQPGTALTVVAQYPVTAFEDVQPDVRSGDRAATYGSAAAPAVNAAAWVAGVGAPLLAAGIMGTLVWTRGRDERYADVTPGLTPSVAVGGAPPTTRGGPTTVAVQFHPPAGVQPGLVGTILDETANPIDVSATVIDLAVRGYLRIEETQGSGAFSRTDWLLTRLPSPQDDRLLPYEAQLLDGLFSGRGDTVALSDLKNEFARTLKRIQGLMYEEVVRRGWFRSSPQTQRGIWQGLGIVLAVAGGLILVYGRAAIAAVLGSGFTGGVALGVGLLVAGAITWVLGGRMAAKTAEGSAVLAQSLGFREYLTTAEAGQIAFEEASNVFSRYLPYAVVFGVADRWATVFADVARAAEASGQSLALPTWYVWSGAAFPDFTSIASGVESFSTTSTGTFTSTPGSSGGSGFSAGGGFSGSGGGGSSSGSW
ncbi:MAG TPA: DUF2207 domain-containing protein [Intrasporangium sp.]|uniref:DUF2207 domain-containing protein n=1 Tax=Intrasporangium sp. TaxID=1925024 RepID=UPI002D79C399|nr:DUF2207 domain-containing protein [Intrasporangium sp.]HET7397773.1 DUF2207 domain-containing protein [Intrasporangium sp.]